MITQFFSHGFAIYVKWDAGGARGKDNHGNVWIKKGGFAICAENADLKFKL